MQKNWLDVFNEIGKSAPTPPQPPPEPTHTESRQVASPPPSTASQSRTEPLPASTRAALMDAIDTGRTAKALGIALRAIAQLTGDPELPSFYDQTRAATGEEWRRAYKAWITHAPRIRSAMTAAEALAAFSDAVDACPTVADGTGEDGSALGSGLLEMFSVLYQQQLPQNNA